MCNLCNRSNVYTCASSSARAICARKIRDEIFYGLNIGQYSQVSGDCANFSVEMNNKRIREREMI